MTRPSLPRTLALAAGLLGFLLLIRSLSISRRQYEASGERTRAVDTLAATPEMVNKGRAVYNGQGGCFVCHGRQLEGGLGPTLMPHAWKDAKGGTLAAILGVVTSGVPNTAMVTHPGAISDAQAREVAAYVWAVSHGQAKP